MIADLINAVLLMLSFTCCSVVGAHILQLRKY